jgi:hypothetical protein
VASLTRPTSTRDILATQATVASDLLLDRLAPKAFPLRRHLASLPPRALVPVRLRRHRALRRRLASSLHLDSPVGETQSYEVRSGIHTTATMGLRDNWKNCDGEMKNKTQEGDVFLQGCFWAMPPLLLHCVLWTRRLLETPCGPGIVHCLKNLLWATLANRKSHMTPASPQQ